MTRAAIGSRDAGTPPSPPALARPAAPGDRTTDRSTNAIRPIPAAVDLSVPGEGGRARAARSGELLRLLGIAAVPTVVYFVVVLRNLTYAWDDFVQFGVAQLSGVGRRLATYDLFEHFGPGNRLTHGLLLTFGGLDPRWAVALSTVVFFGYCLTLADLGRVLGAGWPTVALGLAVATVTPATVFIAAFLDPFFHVMVPVAVTSLATSAYLRWLRSGRAVHAVVGALAVLAGCAVQERGTFVLLFLVLARVLVLDGGLPVRRWVTGVLRDWRFLAALTVIAVADAAIVVLFYAGDAERGGVAATADFVARAWGLRFVPMVTGTYGLGSGAVHAALVVAANALVLALLVRSVLRDRWNIRPWLLIAVWFGFGLTYVGFGRLGLATMQYLLGDPNYYTYIYPAVMIVLTTALAPARSGTGRRLPSGTVLRLAAVVVLAPLVVISTVPFASRSSNLAPDYLASSVQQLHAANSAAPAVVAPTRVPDGLVPGWFPYDSGELFLREADERTVVDVDPDQPRFLDAEGRLKQASGQLLARVEPGAAHEQITVSDGSGEQRGNSFCVSGDGGTRISMPLPQPVTAPGGAVWVRLVGGGGESMGTPVTADGQGSWDMAATGPLTGPAGSAAYLVATQRVAEVDLLAVSGQLCLDAVEVWTLGTAAPDGSCAWVGPYGDLVPATEPASAPRCR